MLKKDLDVSSSSFQDLSWDIEYNKTFFIFSTRVHVTKFGQKITKVCTKIRKRWKKKKEE